VGLLFPDKMKTLILLHRSDKWKPISSVVATIIQNAHAGFFTTDERGKSQTVSPEAVHKAISDAKFWNFVETSEQRSKLTEYGAKIKQGGEIDSDAMESAIADTLEAKTKAWTSDSDVLDVQKLLDEIGAMPDTLIPTPDWLWSEFTSRHPEVFKEKRLSRLCFRQLLLLLGKKGTTTLDDVPMRGYFLPKDSRLKMLRRNEEE
jgi:hypothetical protein